MQKTVLIALLILLAVSISMYIYAKGSIATLRNNLDKQEESLRGYQDKSNIVPSPEAIAELEKSNKASEKELIKLRSMFDSKKQELPNEVTDKGIYLFDSLHSTTKALERKATVKKMIMPSIGFPFDIPKEEDISYLLKQIEMIDHVMNMIIEIGGSEVESIVPQPIDKENKVLDFKKASIQITMATDSDSFVKLLSKLNRHIPLYLVEDISLKSLETNRLRVSFAISRIFTDISLVDIEEYKAKNISDLNTLFPLGLEFESFAIRDPFFQYKEVVKATTDVSSKSTSTSVKKEAKIGQQFTFKGSIYMKDKLTGIIEDNWQGKAYFVVAGDTCAGYKVLSIEDKKAVLSKDNQEIILMKRANNNE